MTQNDSHSNTDNTDTADNDSAGFDLSAEEVRVLAVLIEKGFVTPDNYPMSINAITNGCNQLTGRDPVMALSESEVTDAIDRLMARKLVSRRDSSSARVAKYEHLVRLRYSLPPAEQAVLAALLLRGAQTAGELRQRTERMHAFADIAAVDAVLEHLADKYPPMVAALPRAPGTKETRFAHLIGGTVMFEQFANVSSSCGSGGGSGRGRTAELEDEVRRLHQQLDDLRRDFDTFRAQFD